MLERCPYVPGTDLTAYMVGEHDELRALLQRVSAARTSAERSRALRAFTVDLEQHFISEEDDIFPQWALDHPRDAGQITSFLHDHDTIRHLVDRLTQPGTNPNLGALATLLDRHARDENAVFAPLHVGVERLSTMTAKQAARKAAAQVVRHTVFPLGEEFTEVAVDIGGAAGGPAAVGVGKAAIAGARHLLRKLEGREVAKAAEKTEACHVCGGSVVESLPVTPGAMMRTRFGKGAVKESLPETAYSARVYGPQRFWVVPVERHQEVLADSLRFLTRQTKLLMEQDFYSFDEDVQASAKRRDGKTTAQVLAAEFQAERDLVARLVPPKEQRVAIYSGTDCPGLDTLDLAFGFDPEAVRLTILSQSQRVVLYGINHSGTLVWPYGLKSVPLLSATHKMSAPSFSLPAGPLGEGGSCASAGLRRGEEGVICASCYAFGGHYQYATSVVPQALRLMWVRSTLATMGADGLGSALVAVLRAAARKPDAAWQFGLATENGGECLPVGYFRIHDSGDFTATVKESGWAAYIRAWAYVARALPNVHFWAPTRAWALRSKELRAALEEAAAIPNLSIRPSALIIDDPAPVIPGLAAGTTVNRPGAVIAGPPLYSCPAYATDGKSCFAANCRTCWDNQGQAVTYKKH